VQKYIIYCNLTDTFLLFSFFLQLMIAKFLVSQSTTGTQVSHLRQPQLRHLRTRVDEEKRDH